MLPFLYDKFKSWSEKGSVYILSDTHFNDDDCKLMDEAWLEPSDHINLINKYVHKNDTLVLLGDVGDISYIDKLKAGYKVLIMGNHDESVTKFKKVFDEVYEGALFISDKILLSHEPIYGLDFCLNIHGHNHNKAEKDDKLHLNLASNICRWKPVSLKDIVKQGKISKIQTIHRKTIDNATMKKNFKNFPEKF